MRGQADLVAMRLGGHAPQSVLIETDPFPALRFAKTWPALFPSVAVMQLTPGERPTPAAMRCIVALSVHVGGENRAAVHAVRDACIKAKASRVIASVYRREELPGGHLRFENIETSDTDGVLAWPQ